jgi:hypothetical protein
VQALLHGEHYTRVCEYDSMTEGVAWCVELVYVAGKP